MVGYSHNICDRYITSISFRQVPVVGNRVCIWDTLLATFLLKVACRVLSSAASASHLGVRLVVWHQLYFSVFDVPSSATEPYYQVVENNQ